MAYLTSLSAKKQQSYIRLLLIVTTIIYVLFLQFTAFFGLFGLAMINTGGGTFFDLLFFLLPFIVNLALLFAPWVLFRRRMVTAAILISVLPLFVAALAVIYLRWI